MTKKRKKNLGYSLPPYLSISSLFTPTASSPGFLQMDTGGGGVGWGWGKQVPAEYRVLKRIRIRLFMFHSSKKSTF